MQSQNKTDGSFKVGALLRMSAGASHDSALTDPLNSSPSSTNTHNPLSPSQISGGLTILTAEAHSQVAESLSRRQLYRPEGANDRARMFP
jgi:hypothetical protein